ncbi:MAG: hypothetical protein ACLUD2_08850 [Clostridium sp.]
MWEQQYLQAPCSLRQCRGTAFAAYAPVTGNPEDTYDAETLGKASG